MTVARATAKTMAKKEQTIPVEEVPIVTMETFTVTSASRKMSWSLTPK